ncbi:hypothetical protein C5708_15700 [Caulobacter sp. CCUG 60055]|nr:hypothetical protein [Caulobacter sp. CCUG 60055]
MRKGVCRIHPQSSRSRKSAPFDLIPRATHWFERDGEVECSTMWANSVPSSITHLRMEDDQA